MSDDYETMRKLMIDEIGAHPDDIGPLSELVDLWSKQLSSVGGAHPAMKWMAKFSRYIDEERYGQKETPVG